jgi:hypothetical protein
MTEKICVTMGGGGSLLCRGKDAEIWPWFKRLWGTATAVEEMSPWAGMDACSAGQTMFESITSAPSPKPNNQSVAPCSIALFADPASPYWLSIKKVFS